MFADYRVPQILNRLQVISYPESLIAKLRARQTLLYGSREEVAIRSASILAVEEIRKAIERQASGMSIAQRPIINSVMIDFWLWDMSKKLESGTVGNGHFSEELPMHRTRSIWY
jgi:hypothetical protein